MNIAIVGAGINGITTALELARDGHQVTVYEQNNTAAEEASFAPGGWLQPSAALSLAAPGAGMPLSQLQKQAGLLQASAMIGSPAWRWMRQWKKHEKAASQEAQPHFATALHTLSAYSQSLRWREAEVPCELAECTQGALLMLRTPQEAAFWTERLPFLQSQGLSCQMLDAPQVQAIEPGIGNEIAWLQALHFPQGESINPRLWSQYLRQHAQDLGVLFQTGLRIEALSTHPLGVTAGQRLHLHEAIVLCTGASTDLLAHVQVKLPCISAWGYSITSPVRDPLLAPRASIMDWAQQTTIGRLGQRIRITSGLELGSHASAPHHTATLQRMYRLLNDWFPGGAQLSSPQVQTWRGSRAILPDGLPAVGASGKSGIWLNLAHGSHGAALASGCARALADMLAGHAPALDMQAFDPLRFHP